MEVTTSATVPEQVREACAWVAERSRAVRIESEAVSAYAHDLGEGAALDAPDAGASPRQGDRESRASFTICLDAINFGSGWWPTIAKRPGLSGYRTIAAGLGDRFEAEGAWTAGELSELDPATIAAVVGQPPDHPLMSQFAASLHDVGAHVLADHGGRFERLIDSAAGSAVVLAGQLASWDAFADASIYRGRPVPFFKRAQLAAADVARAGLASFADLARLTAFADNLVPHVLRVDGVLWLDPELERRIDAGELLEHGSPEEVELRACAVQAIELLASASVGHLSAAAIDAALWNRGRGPRYKAIPRPRSRNTAY